LPILWSLLSPHPSNTTLGFIHTWKYLTIIYVYMLQFFFSFKTDDSISPSRYFLSYSSSQVLEVASNLTGNLCKPDLKIQTSFCGSLNIQHNDY
jgi:hypothetical protein